MRIALPDGAPRSGPRSALLMRPERPRRAGARRAAERRFAGEVDRSRLPWRDGQVPRRGSTLASRSSCAGRSATPAESLKVGDRSRSAGSRRRARRRLVMTACRAASRALAGGIVWRAASRVLLLAAACRRSVPVVVLYLLPDGAACWLRASKDGTFAHYEKALTDGLYVGVLIDTLLHRRCVSRRLPAPRLSGRLFPGDARRVVGHDRPHLRCCCRSGRACWCAPMAG